MHLRGEAERREVLHVEVRDEDVVVAQRIAAERYIVQAAVRVLLDAAEHAEVVLVAIVAARAEEAHADGAVLEQEAAEVRDERLDADAEAVEVEAVRDVAQVLVDEERLHAERVVVARGAATWRAEFTRPFSFVST